MEEYKPVPCDFYDQLEAFSTMGTACEIRFLLDEHPVEVKGRIVDLYTREKVEYLKMDSGLEMRLDKIIHVNGIEPTPFC
ncbi:MAG: hypothetical protein INR73_19210 [Williamsia sp.]|nr:hypothetical protein [Williamsia sp.]